jgi:hypothetical protein
MSNNPNAFGTSISSTVIPTLHPESPFEQGTIGTLFPVAGAWYPIMLSTRIKALSNPTNMGSMERILIIILTPLSPHYDLT